MRSSDNAEVTDIERGELVDVQAFSESDDAGVSTAEGEIGVLLHEVRRSQQSPDPEQAADH